MDFGRGLLNIVGRGAEAGFGANVDIIKNDIKRRQAEADDLRKRNLDRIERMRQEGVSLSNSLTVNKDTQEFQRSSAAEAENARINAATADAVREQNAKEAAYANTEAAAEVEFKRKKEFEDYKASIEEKAPKPGFQIINKTLKYGVWKGDTFEEYRDASPTEVEKFNNGDITTSHVTNDKGDVTIIDKKGNVVKTIAGIGKPSVGKQPKTEKKSTLADINDAIENVVGEPTQAQAVIINEMASERGLEYKPVVTINKKGDEVTEWLLTPKTPVGGKKKTIQEEYDEKMAAVKKAVEEAKKKKSSQPLQRRGLLQPTGAVNIYDGTPAPQEQWQ